MEYRGHHSLPFYTTSQGNGGNRDIFFGSLFAGSKINQKIINYIEAVLDEEIFHAKVVPLVLLAGCGLNGWHESNINLNY